MRSRSVLAIGFLAAGMCGSAAATELFIRGGTVVDGSGGPGFRADVAIHDGKIAAIGAVPLTGQERIIDAAGLIVSPGFIDVHSHVPDVVLRQARPAPALVEAFVLQGVTTIVGGPDGLYSPANLRAIKRTFDTQGIATNYAFYVGHNGIRQEVLGAAQRTANAEEIQRMVELTAEGMRMGAVGLSSGLMYEPGMFSTTDELIALARAIKPFDGLYDTHTRDPVLRWLESDQEAIQIGRAAGVRIKIAHEKAVGLLNKGRIHDLIAMIEKERAAGHEVATDQYPYDGAQIMALEDILRLPGVKFDENDPAALAKHRQDVRRALRDSRFQEIRDASEHGIAKGYSVIKAVGYGSLRIVASPGARQLEGENIQLLAERRHCAPFDLIARLILSSSESILVTIGSVDENDLRLLLQQPWDMIASDGGFVGPGEPGPDHPRTYGTFARVLGHYSRDLHLLTLPEAIRKMSALPADFLHISDRGRIAVGQAADIAIFDPQTIADRATYTNPTERAVGVRYVIVNGTLVVDAGRQTSATPGRFVAPTRY